MRDRRRSCCYYNRCSNLMGPHTYLSHRRIIKDLASSQQVGGRSHILGALISQLITDRFRRRKRRNKRFGPACFSTPGNGHFRIGRRRFLLLFCFCVSRSKDFRILRFALPIRPATFSLPRVWDFHFQLYEHWHPFFLGLGIPKAVKNLLMTLFSNGERRKTNGIPRATFVFAP